MMYIIPMIVCWLIAARLTLKADAMLCDCPTDVDFTDWVIAIWAWPFIAILICLSEHACSNKEYHR